MKIARTEENFRKILDSYIQKGFMETLVKIQVYNNREFTDNESAMLMKGFELGFLKGVSRIMDSFPTYKQILCDMQKEVEQTRVSIK